MATRDLVANPDNPQIAPAGAEAAARKLAEIEASMRDLTAGLRAGPMSPAEIIERLDQAIIAANEFAALAGGYPYWRTFRAMADRLFVGEAA